MSFKTTARATPALSGAYRTVWRWHFYAGVMVMPFLLLLTLTGGLYLFKDEIDRLVYRQMLTVPVSIQQVSPQDWVRAAEVAAAGRVVNVRIPSSKMEAVRLRVDTPDGISKTVFVNPYTGSVTGMTAYGGVTETIKQLHSLSLFGGKAGAALNILVEVVAGWAIILCATGLYLWWPRQRQGAVFTLRRTDVERRPFWRDVHALTGFYTAGVIIFLAVTGMPWSAVWGDRFMGLMRESGLGRPPAPSTSTQWSKAPAHHAPQGMGWTMEHTELPLAHNAANPSFDRVFDTARSHQVATPFVVNIPADAHKAWSVATQPDTVESTRILYVDAGNGAVMADVGYKDFGIMAKGMEWGIMVHQGQQYGWLNRILMLAGCVGVWVLGVTGTIMWWKRRPPSLTRRRLGAPPTDSRVRAPVRYGALAAIVMPLAILYPLTGASLLVALLIDKAVIQLLRRSKPVSVNL